MELILDSALDYHVSNDTVDEFEQIILSDNSRNTIAVKSNEQVCKFSFNVWRIVNEIKAFSNATLGMDFLNMISKKNNRHFFTVLMGPNFKKCFPYYYKPVRKSIYLFDAWPCHHELIKRFVRTFDLDHVFLSSSQAVDMLQSTMKKPVFFWIPEQKHMTPTR